jgi:inner membrane protein
MFPHLYCLPQPSILSKRGRVKMDTGTHMLFGLGLGGLAMMDPAVTSHTYGPLAVMIGTIAGSNAPDLDGLLRLKSNADYIKHHRGVSHSLPAIAAWTVLITSAVSLLFNEVSWYHIGFWVLLAVVIHVLSDLFNTYGAKAYWPVQRDWVAWNIIHIFDPVIFIAHLLALLLWVSGAVQPQVIFPVLYALLVLYYVWRTIVHARIAKKVSGCDPENEPGARYEVLPTISLFRWNVIRAANDGTYGIGEWKKDSLKWIDVMKCDVHPAIEASKQHQDVKAFLVVSRFPCTHVTRHNWGYEVRWIDIRYRYHRQFPFAAVIVMDPAYVPLQSYVGWLNDERLQQTLR